MATLHTINQSPRHKEVWSKLFSAVSEGDSVLLIENACYANTDAAVRLEIEAIAKSKAIHFYTLEEDTSARGIASGDLMEAVNYSGFVELSAKNAKVISWCSE